MSSAQVRVQPFHRIKDAIRDHALCARELIAGKHRSEVLRLDPLAARILRRCRVAHAELVGVREGGMDSGICQLGEDLPGGSGLTDPGRTGQPQDGD
jgi:hypothetical protein